ncbi:Apc13p protein-domain-containing protein [Xylariomycetidae sp. FL0641]|nr:Apc13p protein-domain-containing protein [Xylariomycetidae sp. FL0641]
MNKDGAHTHIHLARARHADLAEDFCRERLPDDEIYVPAAHAPLNPEDEDDVVPDQHAAFGIAKAAAAARGGGGAGPRESAWKDLGLAALMRKGPGGGGGGAPGLVVKGAKGLPR